MKDEYKFSILFVLLISATFLVSSFFTSQKLVLDENIDGVGFQASPGDHLPQASPRFITQSTDGNYIIVDSTWSGLGIGTTTPQYELVVNGDIMITGTIYDNKPVVKT